MRLHLLSSLSRMRKDWLLACRTTKNRGALFRYGRSVLRIGTSARRRGFLFPRLGPMMQQTVKGVVNDSTPTKESSISVAHITRLGLGSLFLLFALFPARANHSTFARPRQSSDLTKFTAQITPVDPLNRFGNIPRNYALSQSNGIWSFITRDQDGDGFVDYVEIQIYMLESQDGLAQGYIWFLTSSSERMGRPLAPGHYPNVMRAGHESDGHPGLNIATVNCSLTGEFTIIDAQYNSEFRFAASFRQQV